MIMSLSDNEKNINSSLNSLDISQKMSRIVRQSQNTETLSQQMQENINSDISLIETEITRLMNTVDTLEYALHFFNIHSQDDLLAQCRETLLSFDPEGKITETDLSL